MKRAVFGALLFSLGLAAGPSATVAGRDESLALLCRRYELTTAPDVRYAEASAAEMARNGDHAEAAARLAFVQSMQSLRSMICVTGKPHQARY